MRRVTKGVYIPWYTLGNRHVVIVRLVLSVYLQGLEFPVTYARHFRSQTCFDYHKKKTPGKNKKKSACEIRKCYGTCGPLITHKKYEYNKRFCVTCNEKNSANFAICVL